MASLETASLHAHKLQVSGNLEDAAKLYVAILGKDPEDLMSLQNLAVLKLQVGAPEDSLTLIRRFLRIMDSDPRVWFGYILCLSYLGRVEEAEKAMKLIENKPELKLDNYDYMTLQNFALNSSKNLTSKDIAKFDLQGILLSAPLKTALLEELDRELRILYQLYEQKSFDKARNMGVSLLENGYKSEKLYTLLASIERSIGSDLNAIKFLEIAIKLNPFSSMATNNLGNIYLGRGDLFLAKELFTKAIKIEPGLDLAHCNLGTVYRELGNNDSAVESFKTALKLNPRMSRAHFGVALCYYSQGLYADAAQHFILCHDLDDNQSGLKEFSFQWNLKCLKKTAKQATLVENLMRGVNELKYNGAIIGNILCEPNLNQHLKNPFCDDPLNYVTVTNLVANTYFSENLRNSLLSFCENFSGEGKQQGLLVNGFQTPGDLFLQSDPLFDDVRSIIMSEVLHYKERFKSASEGLFEQWPSTIKIRGWIVSYRNGGAIKPHIHEDGWLSGSLYINVPKDCKGSEGNLLLSNSENVDIEALNKNTDLLVPVKTGDLCLFPASLTHCTVPFSSTERRIVLAFDILK